MASADFQRCGTGIGDKLEGLMVAIASSEDSHVLHAYIEEQLDEVISLIENLQLVDDDLLKKAQEIKSIIKKIFRNNDIEKTSLRKEVADLKYQVDDLKKELETLKQTPEMDKATLGIQQGMEDIPTLIYKLLFKDIDTGIDLYTGGYTFNRIESKMAKIADQSTRSAKQRKYTELLELICTQWSEDIGEMKRTFKEIKKTVADVKNSYNFCAHPQYSSEEVIEYVDILVAAGLMMSDDGPRVKAAIKARDKLLDLYNAEQSKVGLTNISEPVLGRQTGSTAMVGIPKRSS